MTNDVTHRSTPCDRSGVHMREVMAGLTITLDEHRRARVVELLVHTDDVALSVGLDHGVGIT